MTKEGCQEQGPFVVFNTHLHRIRRLRRHQYRGFVHHDQRLENVGRRTEDINGLLTVEEERIVCPGVLDQPPHSTDDICFGWEPPRIPGIVGQDENVLRSEIPTPCRVHPVGEVVTWSA